MPDWDEELNALYDAVDKDGSGDLDPDEFKVLLQSIGRQFDELREGVEFNSFDQNKNGKIERPEFHKCMEPLLGALKDGSSEIKNKLKILTTCVNEQNSIVKRTSENDLSKLKAANDPNKYARDAEPEESPFKEKLNELFDATDANGNGVLEEDEFTTLLKLCGEHLDSLKDGIDFRTFDVDMNGVVDRGEFHKNMATLLNGIKDNQAELNNKLGTLAKAVKAAA